MKNRGRSPATVVRSTIRAGGGTGSSDRSLASDHEHDNEPSTHPGGAGALAAVTSTLAAYTAEEAVNVHASPSHHRRHGSATIPRESHVVDSADNTSLGNSIFYDDPESLAHLLQHGSSPDPALTQKAIDHYQAKIGKTKDLIREVQKCLDDNVNEYLKLSANATDGVQQQRIKQVFEKKNQKSAQNIAQHQKKLEEYNKKVRDLEKHGLQKQKMRDFGQGLKHVGGNIRDGISGMSSTVMSKPKEFANFVLRRNFGSADNLSSMPNNETKTNSSNSANSNTNDGAKTKQTSSSLPHDGSGSLSTNDRKSSSFEEKRKCLSEDGLRGHHRSINSEASETTSTSAPHKNRPQQRQQPNESSGQKEDSGSPQRRALPDDIETASEWNAVVQELTLHKEEVDRLREEIDELRQQFKQDVEALGYQLREERDMYARLEEQINDLTELHQHEIENIKSGINDMEEKVQYQSEERLLDIKEHLQSLETKVTSMEHQQAQQQYLNIEGLDSSDARAIMMKLLNTVITFLHVVLFLVGTFMNLAKPFLRTTPRIVTTTVVAVVSVCAYHQQDTLVALFAKFGQSTKKS